MRPARPLAILLSSALLIGSASATPAVAGSKPASRAGLRLVAVRHSLLATHSWFQQTLNGRPVLGGFVVRHVDSLAEYLFPSNGAFLIYANTRSEFILGGLEHVFRCHQQAVGVAAAGDEASSLQLVEGPCHGLARGADHVREQRVRDREVDPDSVAPDPPVALREMQELALHSFDVPCVGEVAERVPFLGKGDLEQLDERLAGRGYLAQLVPRRRSDPD